VAKKPGQKNVAVEDDGLPPFWNYWMRQEYESHLKGTRLAPWENRARAFADRIRQGTLEGGIGWALQIDRDAFVDLLQELSEAVRSRFDAPSAAAKAAFKQISDALLHTGRGPRRKFEKFKFDHSYRFARKALYEEALVFLEAKKEVERQIKRGEEVTLDEVLKERRRKEPWDAIETDGHPAPAGAGGPSWPLRRAPAGRPVRVLEHGPADKKKGEVVDPQWIAEELHAYIMKTPAGHAGKTIKDRCEQLVAEEKTPRAIRRRLGLATRKAPRVRPAKSHR
jgi:hypothetical protein